MLRTREVKMERLHWLIDPEPTAAKDAFVAALLAGFMIWLYPQHWWVYVLPWLAWFVCRRVWYHYRPYQMPPQPPVTRYTRNH
jgi:hypothetical protein